MAAKQAERTEATRGALVAAARGLFGERGYAATSIGDVVARAGVTRGALYHHFATKDDLFAAVFEREEQELMALAARAGARERDAWRRLHAGCRAFLDACRDPALQRIVLLDAPAALGWDRWREIEERYALAVLRAGIETAMAEGHIKKRPAGPLAHVLLGALTEAALLFARSESASARDAIVREVDQLLEALRAKPVRRSS